MNQSKSVSFPLGRSILVMLALVMITGVIALVRTSAPRADLLVWTFADSHAASFRNPGPGGTPSLVEQFTRETGKTVEVKLINGRAMDVRLISIFSSGTSGPQVPDVVELEIGSVGKFFRPPTQDIGLFPLNELIERDGVRAQLVETRLTPWSKGGVIFGLPHDVHPVSLTYRRDLWEQAGVDLESVQTWPEFRTAAARFPRFCAGKTSRRYAIGLSTTSADGVVQMLLQRGVNVVDDENRVHLTDPRVADTIAFYATLVGGPDRVADNLTSGGVNWTQDLAHGDVAALLTPDWAVTSLRTYAPSLSGKLAMRPLPRFDPTDAPTATWGGTMIGIPRHARDIEASWKLVKHLYLTREAIIARRQYTDILPPVVSMWNDAIYDAPDAFFAGQKTGRLFCDLAAVVPRRNVTPFTTLGSFQLAVVLAKATRHVESKGEAGLLPAVAGWLVDAQKDLEARIEFGRMK